MSANENNPDSEKITLQADMNVKENSKQFFRKKVWDHLEKNKLVTFPRPIHGRIPNFKGADKAATQLLELDEFKNAKSVEVNPDKPLEASRGLVLEYDKVLYVPIPKLYEGLLRKISFCNEDKPENIKQIVNRWGIENLGKSVGFGSSIHIDMLVLGSVAVSKEGCRIGKGKGYADLEFAILKEMKAVDDDTVIVTTVHDSQVFDSITKDIFQKHDVPVDYILTPTQIIKVDNKVPRPDGIYWDLISEKQLSKMPVLQKVKEAHLSEGKVVTLRSVDPEEEEEKPKYVRNKNRSQTREQNGIAESVSNDQRPRRRRYFQRSRPNNTTKENEDPADKEDGGGPHTIRKKQKPFRKNFRKLQNDFSLVVSNIDKTVRVRQLKDALIESGIKPTTITWRGYKGFCYLHYAKYVKKEENEDAEDKPFVVNNVIEILQTLKLNGESSNGLSVKVMEPITRIETTDVTAV